MNVRQRQRYYEEGYLRRWFLEPPSPTQRREAAAFLSLGMAGKPGRVLDLGCGHGRYTTGLAVAGATVTGLDASGALLKRALEQGATDQAGVRFVRGDMRAIPLAQSFDMVLVVDAFGYFDSSDDGRRVLSEVRRVLADGGRLVARMPNGALIRRDFEPSAEEERAGRRTVINRTFTADGQILREAITIEDQEGVQQFARSQYIFSAAEFDSLLSACDLIVEGRYSGVGHQPFDEATCFRMITVARR